jgi:hypothetical protein
MLKTPFPELLDQPLNDTPPRSTHVHGFLPHAAQAAPVTAWSMICRRFASGAPRQRSLMKRQEVALLPELARALKPTRIDGSYIACPDCRQYPQVLRKDAHGGFLCDCPECGPVAVLDDDLEAVALDEDWFRRQLRTALGIKGGGPIRDLGNNVWMLGYSHGLPVLLARSTGAIWRDTALLDQVREPGRDVRIVAPWPRLAWAALIGPGMEWLPLEDRFAWNGSAVTFVGSAPAPSATPEQDRPAWHARPAANEVTFVNGPFSADFKWISLPGEKRPIACTQGQAAVFQVLWEMKGNPCSAEQVMRRAGFESPKPLDLFKARQYADARRAYRKLVKTQRRPGLYSMPAAIRSE